MYVRQARNGALLAAIVWAFVSAIVGEAQQSATKTTSYAPVAGTEELAAVVARMKTAKPAVMKRQMDLLNERYDLSDRRSRGFTSTRS